MLRSGFDATTAATILAGVLFADALSRDLLPGGFPEPASRAHEVYVRFVLGTDGTNQPRKPRATVRNQTKSAESANLPAMKRRRQTDNRTIAAKDREASPPRERRRSSAAGVRQSADRRRSTVGAIRQSKASPSSRRSLDLDGRRPERDHLRPARVIERLLRLFLTCDWRGGVATIAATSSARRHGSEKGKIVSVAVTSIHARPPNAPFHG